MLGPERVPITFLSPSALLGHTYQLAIENSHLQSLPGVVPLVPLVQFITESKVCLDTAYSFPLDLLKAGLLIPPLTRGLRATPQQANLLSRTLGGHVAHLHEATTHLLDLTRAS